MFALSLHGFVGHRFCCVCFQTRYKEAWDCQNALNSLTKNGIYEAGAVMTWLNPLESHNLPLDPPSFKQIVRSEQRLIPTVTKGQERIVWPAALHTYVFHDHIPQGYPKNMFLASGHALAAAWWVPVLQGDSLRDSSSGGSFFSLIASPIDSFCGPGI